MNLMTFIRTPCHALSPGWSVPPLAVEDAVEWGRPWLAPDKLFS